MRLRPLDKDRRPDQLFSLAHFRFFSLLPSINGTHFRVLFLFVCCFANNGGANCPNNCECKWKSGKESVICTNLNLTIVPRNLESSTQVLDLTGNLIRAINKHEFYNLNLINLQKMYIAKCRLKTIDRYAFYKLINLVELDLSYNLLTFVPSASFEFINELRELRLSGNAITRLKSNAFLSVPQLVKLEMSACKINHIELNAFAGLENLLETLKLDNNRMVNVNSSAITRLINLNSLDLSNNHWNCTCQIKPLRLWLSKQNIPFSIPPKCHFPPRLTNRTWDKLDLDDFACKPRVRPLHATYAADETSNITLSCEYSGEPIPNITWAHRKKIIANSTSDKITVNQRLFNLRNLFNTSNLMILSSEVSDSGEYTCWAENRGGKAQASIGLSVIKTVQTTEKHSFIQSKIFVHALFITLLVIIILLFVFIYILVFKNRVRLKSGPRLCNRPSENYDKIELNHCDDQVGPKPVLMMDQSRHSSHEQDKVRHPKLKQYISLSNPSDSRQSLSSPPEANFTLRMPYRGMSSFPESCLEGETLDSGRSELDRRVNGPIRNPESNSNRDDAIRSYYEENFGEVTLQHHVLRKEPIPTGSLYTTTKHSSKTFPDLLESSPPTTRSSGRRKNVYNTLPRMPCQSSQSSHSRSPLLPSSSQASSIENNSSASSRNHLMDLEMSNYHKRNFASSSVINSTSSLNLISVSEMNSGGGACYGGGAARSLFSDNPSLPTSPIRYRDPRADYALSKRHSSLSETPILDILEPAAAASMANRSASHTNQNNLTSAAASSRFSMIASTTYDYHAAQLERFLEEYRSLQVELTRMKASCDNFAKIIDADDRKVLNSTEDIIESRSTKHNSAYQTMDPEPGPRSILKNKSSLNSLTQDSVYSQEKSHFLQEASNLDSASGWNSETSSQFARNLRGNDISNIYYDS